MRKRQKFSISSQFHPASLSSTFFSMRMDNRFLFCCPWTIYMTNGMRSEAIRCETDKRLADTRDDPPRLLLRNAVPYRIVPRYDLPMQVPFSCASDFQSAVADRSALRTPQRKKSPSTSKHLQLSFIFPSCTNLFTIFMLHAIDYLI